MNRSAITQRAWASGALGFAVALALVVVASHGRSALLGADGAALGASRADLARFHVAHPAGPRPLRGWADAILPRAATAAAAAPQSVAAVGAAAEAPRSEDD